MKKIIALALVLVMLFALSACGKEEAPAATEAPVVVETEAPVEATAEPTPEPEPTPTGIEPDSGMHTFKSDAGISFEFDSKYVAMQNPVGNVTVFAGTDAFWTIQAGVRTLNFDTAKQMLMDIIKTAIVR
jgi:predicted small lipoprotein YifL